mmetsp:Transcript_103454/g.154993  ORF Transcript_103454/g.154993 Transcript_103454/m.154993 type:complete len:631 (+) Transcript_103454:191-2083(+)
MLFRTKPSSALAVVVSLLFCHVVQASITIVDSGKVLDSTPDKHLGTKLSKGYEYIGRLQYVHTNLQLCKGEGGPFMITTPPDGLPVALVAKTGGCSLEEKALVASTMMEPANKVAYLIVDDYGKKGKKTALRTEDDVDDYAAVEAGGPFWAVQSTTDEDEWVKSFWDGEEEDEESGWFSKESYVPSDDESVKFIQNLEDAVIVSDDETLPTMPDDEELDDMIAMEDGHALQSPVEDMVERYATFVTLNDDATSIHEDEEPPQQHRVLKKHKKSSDDSINVAILHVSYRSGYELFDLVLKEDRTTYKAGGPKILLNNKTPSASAKTIFLWTMLSIICMGGLCCCIMIVVNESVEEAPTPPPRPVRRRLTYDQVRASHPAFRYNPEEHVEAQLDECSICLDDFVAGSRCRQLPCDHIFHSACIGRWLIERSATCPLCKIDLYEEEETSDEEEEEAAPAERELPTFREWWRSVGMIHSSAAISAVPATTATTPAATVTPATTGASSSWWPSVTSGTSSSWWLPASRRPAPRRDGEDNTTTESRPRRGGIWRLNFFGRPNRRREGEGMLTELTEPLITGELSQATEPPQTGESPHVEAAAAPVQQQPEVASGSRPVGDQATPAEPTAVPTGVEV